MNDKTWIEISSANLRYNLAFFTKRVAPAQVMAVVKANAYGHGLLQVASALKGSGLRWFAVDQLDEALQLRAVGLTQSILVLGYIPLARLDEALKSDISFVVYNKSALLRLQRLTSKKRRARIHLKIETGLHRQGIDREALPSMVRLLKRMPYVFVEGISTHFANVEDTRDQSYARLQLERFREVLEELRSQGIDPPLRHTASSAAALLLPDSQFNAIRLGISLYGLWSSEETHTFVEEKILRRKTFKASYPVLKPALTWKALVAQVKTVKKGEPISYGLTERARADLRVAVLPIGYSDGFPRALSSQGQVLIHGKRCRVLGRVCMNMCMVDVTQAGKVKEEDEVVLIGTQKGEILPAEDQARHIPTSFHYELISRLNPLIPRILL